MNHHSLHVSHRSRVTLLSMFALVVTLACSLARADSTVVFNEIMYHPESGEARLEWVELHNQMGVDMDISGWSLARGIFYTFPEGTVIRGGGHLVVAIDPAALEAATGVGGVHGPFTGRLDNSGERLELRNNSFRLMDSVRYRDEDEWPVAPDGSGLSLAKVDPDSASERAENWAPSVEIGGTPGAPNFPESTGGGTPLPPGLVSYWSLDETGGVARDSAGGNDGTVGSGATRVAGIVGSGALSFDNTTDAFVNVGNGGDSYSTTTGITIEALVRPAWSGAAGDYDEIFRKEDGTRRILLAFQNDDDAATRDVPIDPPGQPVLSFGLNVGGSYSELDMPLDGRDGRPSLAALQDGRAHHVAATYSSATGVKAIFVDGVLAFSADLGAGSAISSGGIATAYIGNMSGRREPFTGVIDEVAFWSRGLAAAEIASHFAAFRAGRDYFSAPGGGDPGSITLAFNEIFASIDAESWIEIVNHGAAPVALAGVAIVSAGLASGELVLGEGSLPAGEYLTLTATELGFEPVAGNKLFLYSPDRRAVIDAAEVKRDLRGRHPEATGPWRFPSEPTPGAANRFAFRDEIVINEIMYHQRARPATPPTSEENLLLPIDSIWRYDASGDGQTGSAWRQPGFDDATWPRGRALIYNESAALPAPKNTEIALGPIAFYFRTTFTFSGDPEAVRLDLRPIIDDGAVFYLNGVEVFRLNMPDGAVTPTTQADTGVADATFSGPFSLPVDMLRVGTNVLAVEVHQVSPTSSDVVFGVELFASIQTGGGPIQESPESWIELYNRSDVAVDLTGWRLDGGVAYSFEDGTTLGAGDYLVVADDSAFLRALHPGVRIVGDLDGRLSRRGDLVILKDSVGNPADEVRYFDGRPWPELADGGRSSLELRHPDADNSLPGAWAASDESLKPESAWKTYTYREVARANIGPTQWREFVFGLLDDGEVLIDDLSVLEDPGGARIELISNGTFESGTGGWRIIGNHRHSRVIDDPDRPGNRVLHLVATGATEHMHNHAETTLAGGRSVTNGRVYEVSFRARWLAGSNQLHTRLYFNRVPRTTLIDIPPTSGTPGAENSTVESAIGPTFHDLRHAPAVPASGEAVTVSIVATDPDGVDGCTLWWSVDDGSWRSASMTANGDGRFAGTVPGQSASRTVQFYVEAADALGATATWPAGGRESRALYRVDDGQARSGDAHNLRIIMTPEDTSFLHEPTNVMSNDRLGATVVYREREVFYDCGVRLKGSERGRNQPNRVGFNVRFPADRLFRGVHRGVAVDRSGGWALGTNFGQDEILIKHMIQHAGDIPGEYVDLIRIIAPQSRHTGPALLQMARFNRVFLDSQFENGGDGTVFEFELIYYPTTTAPNGLKLPEPDGVLGVDLQDLGDDKEVYRWNFIPGNNRDRDDFSGLIPFLQTMSLSGSSLESRIADVMDVDEWMRTFAMMALCGVGDAYTWGNNHNLRLYDRPSDRRVLAFPWDWDFAFVQSTSAPLWGSQNLAKVITRPPFQRLYYGHLLDIIETTYNTTYMSRWIDHYGSLAGRSYGTFRNYIAARGNFVRSRLPSSVAFTITTNGGRAFTVATPDATLEGNGWIDVRTIAVAGRADALAVTWTGLSTWRARVPLDHGVNELTLIAFNHRGEVVGSDDITVTTTFDPPPPVIASIVPAQAFPGAEVTIEGSEFGQGAEVLFGATPATAVERLGATTIRATVPPLVPGAVDVVVRNADGDTSNAVRFTVLEPVPMFIRGDANLDGIVDLSDAVRIILHLFAAAPTTCPDAADVDDDEDLDITDAIVLLEFLFKQGPPPPAPFPDRGEDPGEPGELGCELLSG